MEQIIGLFGGMRLIQSDEGFRLGMDSILLAHYPKLKKGMSICDFGCGSGCIPLMLLARESDLNIDAVELDPQATALAVKNAELNKVKFNIFNHDIRCHKGLYDLVISNPPYFSAGSGKPAREPVRLARGGNCTLDELCVAAASVLRHGGEFCLIYRAEKLVDIFKSMREAGIEPKSMRLIAGTVGSVPKLVLISGKKGSRPSLKVLPQLVVRNEDGTFTDEVSEIYEGANR